MSQPPVAVIDIGSYWTRAGFASDNAPRAVIPSVVGKMKHPSIMVGFEAHLKDHYVGEEAKKKRGILLLKYPMEGGIVTNWDDIEKLLHHVFKNELDVSPEEHPVLLTEAPTNPKVSREKMTQVMFETFKVPAVYMKSKAALALLASGRSTGLVLDSGDSVSLSVPIYEGHVISHAVRHQFLAGRDLTYYMRRLLEQVKDPIPFTNSPDDYDTIGDIKEKLCYVAQDFEKELQDGASNADLEKSYEVYDTVLKVGSERFRCPEALFRPSLVGRDDPGIQEIVHSSIRKCDSDLRDELCSNIVLAGGNTMYPGFAARLKKELRGLSSSDVPVNVSPAAEGLDSVWRGGSIVASLPDFQEMCVSKKEYEEFGPNIVHTKLFQ